MVEPQCSKFRVIKAIFSSVQIFWFYSIIWAPSSEFVSSSIPSWQIVIAHAQPFRGARDLIFCLKVPLDLLLVWASSEGSGETARMRRLAWTFAARIGYKYQIRLMRSIWAMPSENLTAEFYNGKRLKHGAQPLKLGESLGILDLETTGIMLSRQWATKEMIRLHECAGWYLPLLSTYSITRFSHDMAHLSQDHFVFSGVKVKGKGSLSLMAIEQWVVRAPLCLGHSMWTAGPNPLLFAAFNLPLS